MHCAGDQLLTGAALAVDEDTDVATRYSLDLTKDIAHRRGTADHPSVRTRVGSLLEVCHFVASLLESYGMGDCRDELGALQWLGKVVEGAAVHGVDDRCRSGFRGQHEHRDARMLPVDRVECVEPAQTRQVDVEAHGIG